MHKLIENSVKTGVGLKDCLYQDGDGCIWINNNFSYEAIRFKLHLIMDLEDYSEEISNAQTK